MPPAAKVSRTVPISAAALVQALTLSWVGVCLAFAWTGVAPWHAQQHAAPGPLPHSLSANGPLQLRAKNDNKDNPALDFVVGLFLLPMSFALIWLNEAHAARMKLMMRFLQRKVKIVQDGLADSDDLRKPLFVTGESRTEDKLTLDEWGGLTAPANSAKIRAMSFMLQWEEEHEDHKTKYKQRWVHHQVNSDNFLESGHTNPDFPTQPTTVELAKVTLGGFVLSMKMLGKLQDYQPCELNEEMLSNVQHAIKSRSAESSQRAAIRTTFEMPTGLSDTGTVPSFYFPKNSGSSQCNPDVGDLIVVFQYVQCGPMSVLGVQVPISEHTMGGVLVPGTRCSVFGSRAAEISEVTPPPRPFQVHYTHGLSRFEWMEANGVQPTKVVKPWHEDSSHLWTFVPVQYTQDARDTKLGPLLRANTASINVGDEARQTLLGENEADNYLEDIRSVSGHLCHGVTQAIKAYEFSCNPIDMARAFLQGSSPDEVCLCYPGIMSFDQAIDREKELERKVNNGVRVFGTLLMWFCFILIMRPLTWLLSMFWIFGAVIIVVLKMLGGLLACFCSGCTMAGAWAFYCPELALPISCGLISVLYLFHLEHMAQQVVIFQ